MSKKIHLAIDDPAITSTYVGEAASGYVAAAILGAPTIQRELIKFVPNVKKKLNLSLMANTGLIQAAACEFANSGTSTITEKVLTITDLMVNLGICIDNFNDFYEAMSTGASAFDRVADRYMQDLLADITANVATDIENNIWSGNSTDMTANPTLFDGVHAVLEDAAAGGKVGSYAAITTGTAALSKIREHLDLQSAAVRRQPDFKCFVSPNVAHLLVQRYNDLGVNAYWGDGSGLKVDGYTVEIIDGIDEDYVFTGTSSNIVCGTGLLSDLNRVDVLDQRTTTGANTLHVVMRFGFGVQIAYPAEVTYDTIAA